MANKKSLARKRGREQRARRSNSEMHRLMNEARR